MRRRITPLVPPTSILSPIPIFIIYNIYSIPKLFSRITLILDSICDIYRD